MSFLDSKCTSMLYLRRGQQCCVIIINLQSSRGNEYNLESSALYKVLNCLKFIAKDRCILISTYSEVMVKLNYIFSKAIVHGWLLAKTIAPLLGANGYL